MSKTHALGGKTPVWKQEFSKEIRGDQKINVEVHDADPGGKTDFCGQVTNRIDLQTIKFILN